MKKEILLIIATHGDEKIGLEIADNLKNISNKFDVLIANPRAMKLKKRFVDTDLNRSYPGNRFSGRYEERRAYENMKIAKRYEYVIDIHEAGSGTEDFIIVPRNEIGNIFPVGLIGLEKLLLWPFPQGPLAQFLENSVELEFGMRNRKRKDVVKKATKIIRDFMLRLKDNLPPDGNKKEYYYVYGKKETKKIKDIEKYIDFEKTKLGDETFYPLLVGQYLKDEIAFYKMKKIRNCLPNSKNQVRRKIANPQVSAVGQL